MLNYKFQQKCKDPIEIRSQRDFREKNKNIYIQNKSKNQ